MTASYSKELIERASRASARRETVIRPPSATSFDLFGNLAQLFQYRDLFYTLSAHRIRVRYKQTLLGISWAMLQPLSMMLIFTVVFSFVVRMPSDEVPYAVFVYTALLAWNLFSSSLLNASSSLVNHAQLVTKVYFPREILPLTYLVASLFDFVLATTILAGLMFYYGVVPTIYALYGFPIILTLILFATAMSLVCSATQIRVRDIGVALPLVVQFWMFASPVVYPLSAVPFRFRNLYLLNPLVGIIENFRRVIVQGQPPDFGLLGTSVLITLILLPLSYFYFKKVEATLADNI